MAILENNSSRFSSKAYNIFNYICLALLTVASYRSLLMKQGLRWNQNVALYPDGVCATIAPVASMYSNSQCAVHGKTVGYFSPSVTLMVTYSIVEYNFWKMISRKTNHIVTIPNLKCIFHMWLYVYFLVIYF